jgi:hypothetical protein
MRYNEELSGSSRTVRIHKNYHRMHQNCQDAEELSGCSRTIRMQQNCKDPEEYTVLYTVL